MQPPLIAPFRYALLLIFSVSCLCGQTVTVGGGAPPAIANAFQLAFFQDGFNLLVSPTPDANVTAYGPAGYYQQFSLATNSSVKLGLVYQTSAGVVEHVIDPMYSYFSTVGVNTAGYPTMDTMTCPGVAACVYQLFSNNYALFYYSSGNPNGNGFSTSGVIYTLWNTLGGVSSSLGFAYSAQAAVVSPAGTKGNAQTFTGGEAIALTSGVNSGTAFAVVEPIYDFYSIVAGGPTGTLGMPTSNDLTLADGSHRQNFEGGHVVYTVGNPPAIQLSVAAVSLSPAGPVTLQYGQTATVTANLADSAGYPATGRVVSWATSNSSAVTVMANGYSATIKAVGSGIANITAISEGIAGKALTVTAIEPCCQVGQGAPTTAIQAAFQAAVTRNKITVLVPAAAPVRLAGTGYLQDLYSPDGTIHYLVAKSNLNQLAYVVTGPVLTAYTALGGPTGSLAYPASDLSSGGTQLFEGGALAGNPVQTVTGNLLAKWAATNYEAGPLGAPNAAQSAFASASGYSGFAQTFANGEIFAVSNGNLAGQGFQSSGLILARYLALNGPAGEMGVPLGDPTSNAGVSRQNFENGYIDLQPGASAAVEHLAPRTPAVTLTPAIVLPGSRLHLSITGFNNNATLKVSQTGQTAFQVTVPNGSYQWDAYIASSATVGTVTVQAADTAGAANASATYTVRSLAAAQPKLTKSQGDNQTSPPGTVLATPLSVILTDSSGIPIPGSAVTFVASPGASVTPASAVTDSQGRASAAMRLPGAPGIAAVTAQALGQIAIFDAQASGTYSLPNYPASAALTPAGAQVAAAASMLRYYQDLAAIPAPKGLATPALVDQFLKTLADGYLNSSQLVNFWRLAGFAGGNVTVSPESADLGSIRTFVAGGDPVLLSLALIQDGTPTGGTLVVATGIGADGSVTIFDPNPAFAQVNLNSYLNGFAANGHSFQGTVLSALRLLPSAPSTTGFVLDAISQPANAFPALTVQSPVGACATPLIFDDAYLIGTAPPANVLASKFVYCDGSQPAYQATVGQASPYQAALIDLSAGGTTANLSSDSVAAYQITRSNGALAVAAPTVAFTSASVLNAASFVPGLSPGGIFSLFGSGLAGNGQATSVQLGGQTATVLLATPFQINAQVPAAATAGSSTVRVTSPYGTSSQPVTIQAAAPGIFVFGTASDGVTALGAVVNQSGAINGATAPAPRGSTITIYCTGLGATTVKGGLAFANASVTAVLNNTVLPVSYAGLTPGFTGLYQVNVPVPAATPPGLVLPLAIQAGGVMSNVVAVAVQ